MGIAKARRYCPEEEKMVLAQKQTPNHILHLLLTLVTFGAWAIVWAIVAVSAPGRYRCPSCGAFTHDYSPKQIAALKQQM